MWLVTADGSVDCSSDPGNQELHVEFLHYCEALTGLGVLKNGGTFVLKIFTMFEDSTICLLYLLNICFTKVSVFKPASSKSGNSEVYVICLDFKGFEIIEKVWEKLLIPYKTGHFDVDKSMFDLNKINKDFLNQLLQITNFFMKKQIEHINDNIKYFKNDSKTESGIIHQIKIYIANRYINKYKLKRISQQFRLVSALDVSYFFTIETKRFKFENGVTRFDVKKLIPMDINCDILDVKLGERFSDVKSSRFCSSFDKFIFRKHQGQLFDHLRNKLQESSTVITLDNFSTIHEFHKYFFYKIFNSNKSNFLIVRIPLLTNFLVGLLFILISFYKEVYLHKSGLIVLSGTNSDFRNRKQFFEIIHKSYNTLSESKLFECDILQVVSPNLFYNNNYFDFIWNYNQIILK